MNSFIFFVEHRGFPWFFVGTIKPWSSQTKDYKIGICCFSCKHVALRRKSKDRLAWNQDNVSEWEDMSICGLLFQWASTINPTKCVGLVQRGPHHDLIEDYVVLAMIWLKHCRFGFKQKSLKPRKSLTNIKTMYSCIYISTNILLYASSPWKLTPSKINEFAYSILHVISSQNALSGVQN